MENFDREVATSCPASDCYKSTRIDKMRGGMYSLRIDSDDLNLLVNVITLLVKEGYLD